MFEEYRTYKDGIEISNLGNVRKDGKELEQHKGEYYFYICIGGIPVRVHTMVGKCFPEICGGPILFGHYHHLNHNPLDNRAENIKCITNSEHIRLHKLEDGVSISVKAYDKNGVFVGRWDSKTQAAEATGADYRHISEIIEGESNRYTTGNLCWFKEDTPEEDVVEFIEQLPRKNKVTTKKRKRKHKMTEKEKKEYQKKYYQLNKEKRKEYQMEYYRKKKASA